jgi:serine palmitoyltransferase
MPLAIGATPKDLLKEWKPLPALKVCVTSGLSKRDTERAGVVIRHAITTVMKSKKWQR